MYTLHDRFPDFDFGEDAQEDHTQFISIKPLNFSGYNFKFVQVLLYPEAALRGSLERRCFEFCIQSTWQKQQLKNYRSISLFPIFRKNFERIIYNNIFDYMTTNKLISDNQSGFKRGDSYVIQLLSITHEIYHSLDNGQRFFS